MKTYRISKATLLAALVCILTLGLSTQAEAQKRIKWKMHSAWSSSVPHLGTSAVRFSENITRLSGGNSR